jgi:hypothetical protein
MNVSVTTLIMAVLVLGLLAFMISVITQATKGLGFLTKIPTKLQVLVLGIGLSLITYFAYVSYSKTIIVWYYIAGAVMVGIFAAVIASNGWEYFIGLFQRFVSPNVISNVVKMISGIFNTTNNTTNKSGFDNTTKETDKIEKK